MSSTKAAWGRIRERIEAGLAKLDEFHANPPAVADDDFFSRIFGPSEPETGVKSINDEIQAEYRAGRITEDERNQMRAHVKAWLGDPDAPGYDYATYACGLWAPSAAPMGVTEHAYILGAVVVMEEESE